MMSYRLYILLSIAYALISQDAISLTTSELKTYTGPECGAPSYRSSQRVECGVEQYALGTGDACGPKSFNTRADLLCPGSDAGGRQIRGFFIGGSVSSLKIGWQNDINPIQGTEDITQIFGKWLAAPSDGPHSSWSKVTDYWHCSLSYFRNSVGAKLSARWSYSGTIICQAKPDIRTCEKPEFGIATYNSCQSPVFGVASYRTCEDHVNPIYPTCQLRRTRAELEAYLDSVAADVSFQAELYATNLSNFLTRSQEKLQSACMISKYAENPLYAGIVNDLIDRFETTFGEIYQGELYSSSCEGETFTPSEVQHDSLICSAHSTQEVRDGIAQTKDDIKLKRFYQDCFSQKAYEVPLKWFQHHLAEIQLLLDDAVAKSEPLLKKRLEELYIELSATQVTE